MIKLDQMAGTLEKASVFGIPCIFGDMKMDRSTIPEGRYMYEVAGDNDGGEVPVR